MLKRFSIAVMALSLLGACDRPEDTQPTVPGGNDVVANQALPAAAPELEATDTPAQLTLAQAGAESRFELGAHYELLTPTQPTSSGPDQVEVAEVFWYGCPHCFSFEPYLETWQPAEYVSFVRVPAVWNPTLRLHARAFYTAEALGKSAEMHGPIFEEIHVNGNFLDDETKLAQFFARFGVSTEDFQSAFNSFTVETKLQRADELNRRYRISSVPSVVINGKYTSNATMAGSYDRLIELIDELAARENAGN